MKVGIVSSQPFRRIRHHPVPVIGNDQVGLTA